MGHYRSQTAAQSRFAQVPSANIQRSAFKRSHSLKTTFDSGLLIPIFVDEVLPGDTFNLRMTAFSRLATPLFPLMDNLVMEFFFFFVPNRLVWDNWQKFNGEQLHPGDSTDFTVPLVTAGGEGWGEQSLGDYFGIPTKVGSLQTNALYFRAYNLIYNEWFRDENIDFSTTVPTDDGPDSAGTYLVLRRRKRHDYFTSCLPWPQKGDAVELPLTGNAPLVGTAVVSGTGEPSFSAGVNPQTLDMIGTDPYEVRGSGDPGTGGTMSWNDPQLEADLSTGHADLSMVTAATINELREAFQLQRLYERDARGGTRYVEILRSHFGVTSPDARLQRPEYLGGGRIGVNVMPVPQTSETATTPQGNLSAFGVGAGDGIGFNKSFTEHGMILGLVSVRADYHYQQGLDRMWTRQTRWDYYWPALAFLGEQAVLSREIFTNGQPQDHLVWGYQERYAEYRYKPSRVTGLMRSNADQSLDAWHLALDFAERPLLNSIFLAETPPVKRVIAVPTEPEFLFDAFFDLQCARPMPTYSVPGLIDHF